MIHPFSHMNSVFAAEQLKADRGDVTAARRRDFAELLQARTAREAPAASVAVERQVANETPAAGSVPNLARQRTAPPVEVPAASGSPTETPRVGPPRFDDVPESVKWPSGPYRQAPAEYGGQWWLVNPFTGPEPWAAQTRAAALFVNETETTPPGFQEVFGPKPSSSNAGGAALASWLQNLEQFKGVGIPDGFTEADVELAGAVYDAWGMSRPVFYNGRYGWRAAFVDGNGDSFQASAFTSLAAPHLVVARRQINQIGHGLTPPTIHPFVPPGITGPDSPEGSTSQA